ncbi:MAG: LacI family DNA-binding transcriptional regulator [Clostridia bacterium]|nr:LacI family DNA-binding transcriptional regulator [Clostridia bacterium]
MQEKRKTIYDIAAELGVSIAAVSRAFDPSSKLSREKRDLILATAKKYGYTPNKMASRLSMNEIKIGVVNFSYIKVYYSEIIEGIKDAWNNLKDYKVDCDMRILQRGENTMEEALAVLDEFYANHYDGVIISGMYEDCVVTKVNKLVEAGIRVATLQYDLGNSKRHFSCLSNYNVIGEMAAQLCGMLLRDVKNRKTVMFTGNKVSPTHQTLIEAFCNGAKKYNVDIVDIYDTRDDPECAREMVIKAFGEYPDIAAIYASSANSVPICRYLEGIEHGKDIAFVASDVFPDLHPYIENGYIDATIYQEPYKMGYVAFDKLYHSLADNEVTRGIIMSTPRVVMSSNLYYYK